jgi:hypothetical protein
MPSPGLRSAHAVLRLLQGCVFTICAAPMRRSYSGAVHPLDVVARRPGHDPAVMLRSLPKYCRAMTSGFGRPWRQPGRRSIELGPSWDQALPLFTGRSAKTLEKLAGVEGLEPPTPGFGVRSDTCQLVASRPNTSESLRESAL